MAATMLATDFFHVDCAVMAAAFSGIGDKGYQGSGFITPFKKPQGGKLLDWQKEFNAQVNRLRAPRLSAIAHLKSWRILHTDLPATTPHIRDVLQGRRRTVLL